MIGYRQIINRIKGNISPNKINLILFCLLINILVATSYLVNNNINISNNIENRYSEELINIPNEISISTESIFDDTNNSFSYEITSKLIRPTFKGLLPSNNNTIEEYNQNVFWGKPQTVIGNDDLVRITPTTSYPWRTIVKLYITWGNDTYVGSGALIDKNHVLTAGHCVYYRFRGGWADSIKVVPGMDDGNEPYGHAWAVKMRTYDEWIYFSDYQHDFAVITLDRNLGLQWGYMGLETTFPSNSIYTGGLNVAGYPNDRDNGLNLYWDTDTGREANEYVHWYYMDTVGGMSGSPVWRYDGLHYFILSVHAYGMDGTGSNHGTRIDKNKFDCINNWLLADNTSTSKPDLADRGNCYSGFNISVVGSGLTNFKAWCDVQNLGTTSPGMFTVSYYASNNTVITRDDYLIGTDILPTATPTYYIDSDWIGKFPDYIPSGMYFIGWIIDSNDEIDEFKEDNNVNFNWTDYLLVDGTPPSNPTNCCQLIGNTESDVWQDSVNDPSFSWSGASDLHTSVAGYYYYWGSDPNGTSSSFTLSTEYDTPAVNNGTYYLRVCATDTVRNNASWTTLYIFKYNNSLNESIDESLPENNIPDNLSDNPEGETNEDSEEKSNVSDEENLEDLLITYFLMLQLIGLSSLMAFLLIKYYFKRREFVFLKIFS